MAIPAAMFIAPAIQGALGIGQMIGGMSMRPERPTYNIPREISDMLALRQMNLRGRMAGATQAQQNIMQAQGSTIGAYQGTMRNPNAILAGVSASQGQTNRAFTNLASMEAQDYQRRLAGLEGAQRTMAGYRDRAFEVNEMQPYMDEARTKAALIGAGLRNVAGGASSLGGIFSENQYMEMMQQMYGGGQQGMNTPVSPVDMLPSNPLQPVQSQMTPPTPQLPNVNFFGPQSMGQGEQPMGVGTLTASMAFNDWLRRTTGKNPTEMSNSERAYYRSLYPGQ